MTITVDLLVNAVAAGILLGMFYAAVTAGATISFGLLHVVNIAHPALVILGAYAAYLLNSRLGLDVLVAGVLLAPLFYGLGTVVFGFYHYAFDRHGGDSMRGLAFFFGLMFVVEISLIMSFGVDFRYAKADYATRSYDWGVLGLPLRLVIPFAGSLVLLAALQLYLTKTFTGRAILGVSQDPLALRLMGIDPDRLKAHAFALSVATATVVGSMLLIVEPVEPATGREFIGRVFAICVLGGMGSIPGTVVAAIMLGVVENLSSLVIGASWAPAVSFGFLVLTLALRPSGLFGRA